MRFFLAGVAVVVALAGTAEGGEVPQPGREVRVHMRFDDETTVHAVVDGIAQPTSEDLLLYPRGHRELAVHPASVEGLEEELGPPSLVVVFRTHNPAVAATMKDAFERLHLEGIVPGIQVTMIDDATPGDDAVTRTLAALDKRPGILRRYLVLVRDDCDGTLLEAVAKRGHGHRTAVFQLSAQCEHGLRQFAEWHNAIGAGALFRAMRESVPGLVGTAWFATFDVGSLGVIATGERELVLEIAGYVTHPAPVLFPKPYVEPSWLSSPLRQLGLGALVVGLIALIVRSRVRALRAR